MGRAGVATAACGTALMPGHAFSIEDALIASRWAGRILSRGYRVVIAPGCKNAEEVIEVYIPGAEMPTFTVHRTAHAFLITDCIGLTLSFPILADALLAMAPLSKSDTREMLKGAVPAWLPAFTTGRTREANGILSRLSRALSGPAVLLASWRRG